MSYHSVNVHLMKTVLFLISCNQAATEALAVAEASITTTPDTINNLTSAATQNATTTITTLNAIVAGSTTKTTTLNGGTVKGDTTTINKLNSDIAVSGITTTATITTTIITTTTTPTTRSVICPTAVWNPSATTVAGSASGTSGLTTALLNGAYDVVVDYAFNVYVADFNNHRVMKWSKGGLSGTKVGPQLGNGAGPDTQHMKSPSALCFDSTQSNLYISDSTNCRILKWNLASNNITIVAGGTKCGTALNQFNWSDGIYVDRFGYLYVADYHNARVLKFPPNSNSSTKATLVAGTGKAGATLNKLNTPWNIYVDESDNDALYIADYANNRVMKWLLNANTGTIVAGGHGAGSLYTQLHFPMGVFVDSFGTVYVTDYSNQRVMKWLKNAKNGTLVAGIAGSTGATPKKLSGPSGMEFDKNGNLYVSEYLTNRVQLFKINNTSCL